MGWSGVWRLPPFPGTAGRNFNYHCNCSGWYPALCSSGKNLYSTSCELKEEQLGLDVTQHGENAYPSFNGLDQ